MEQGIAVRKFPDAKWNKELQSGSSQMRNGARNCSREVPRYKNGARNCSREVPRCEMDQGIAVRKFPDAKWSKELQLGKFPDAKWSKELQLGSSQTRNGTRNCSWEVPRREMEQGIAVGKFPDTKWSKELQSDKINVYHSYSSFYKISKHTSNFYIIL